MVINGRSGGRSGADVEVADSSSSSSSSSSRSNGDLQSPTEVTGLIASSLSSSTCPWTIRVQPYQRINISLIDFLVSFSIDLDHPSGRSQSGGSSSPPGHCLPYAVISEEEVDGHGALNVTLCGAKKRESVAYISHRNVVHVYMNTQYSFLIKYDGEQRTPWFYIILFDYAGILSITSFDYTEHCSVWSYQFYWYYYYYGTDEYLDEDSGWRFLNLDF